MLTRHALHRIHRLEQRQTELRDNPDPEKLKMYNLLDEHHRELIELETTYAELIKRKS